MACSTIWLWFLDGGCIVTVFQFVWCRFVSLAFVAFCFVRSFIASASSFAAMYKGLSRLHPVPLFPKQFTTVAVFDALKEWPPWCETVWPGLWLVPCICPPLSSLFASLLVAWCVRLLTPCLLSSYCKCNKKCEQHDGCSSVCCAVSNHLFGAYSGVILQGCDFCVFLLQFTKVFAALPPMVVLVIDAICKFSWSL
jgi:hypothetical protein